MSYQHLSNLSGSILKSAPITKVPTIILLICLGWTVRATSTQSGGPVPATSPMPSTLLTSTIRPTSMLPPSRSASAGGAAASIYQENYPFGFGPDGLTPLGETGSPSSFNDQMTASPAPLSVLGLSSADLASAPNSTASLSTQGSVTPASSIPTISSLSSVVQPSTIVSSIQTPAPSTISSPPPISSTPSSSPPPPPPPPPTTTTAPPPPPTTTIPTPTPTPTATDDCDFSYKALWDTFDIRGKSFNMDAFGTDGAGLHTQVSGCGSVSKWHFEWTPSDAVYQWHAWGRLPVGTKGCVGRAIVSAGGLGGSTCHGSG